MNDKDFEKLVFGMTHQIRNPCAIILANASLILQNPDLKAETRRSLESIINGAKYLESRLDEFVEFSKPIRLILKEVSLNKLLNQTVSLLAEKCQLKRTKISCNLNGELVLPKADYDQILLAFLNITLNSIESIQEWGTISLEARPEGKNVLISVKDSGCGIHPRDLPEVFSPFYSTKEGGVGIGLAVSKKIIESHEGKIELQSQLGKGTTVIVFLPGMGKESRG